MKKLFALLMTLCVMLTLMVIPTGVNAAVTVSQPTYTVGDVYKRQAQG